MALIIWCHPLDTRKQDIRHKHWAFQRWADSNELAPIWKHSPLSRVALCLILHGSSALVNNSVMFKTQSYGAGLRNVLQSHIPCCLRPPDRKIGFHFSSVWFNLSWKYEMGYFGQRCSEMWVYLLIGAARKARSTTAISCRRATPLQLWSCDSRS